MTLGGHDDPVLVLANPAPVLGPGQLGQGLATGGVAPQLYLPPHHGLHRVRRHLELLLEEGGGDPGQA